VDEKTDARSEVIYGICGDSSKALNILTLKTFGIDILYNKENH
jgi:hypothetical protein